MTELYYNASNFIVSNGFIRNPERYYLEEYFAQKPQDNATSVPTLSDNNATNTISINNAIIVNKNFEILGTSVSNDGVTFSVDDAGIVLQTNGAANDQVIVLPHLIANQSAWTNTKWGTENQVEWDCAIKTGALIADTAFWAGFKSSIGPTIATDDNQAYFIFSQVDDVNTGTLTTNKNLHFVYSIDGTDYVTDLGLQVAVNSQYRLKIRIDSIRKVSVFVNETQYGLTQTTGTTGIVETVTNNKSLALENDRDLKPYVGVQALANNVKQITLSYEKISRHILDPTV